jgi:hypothetical protein
MQKNSCFRNHNLSIVYPMLAVFSSPPMSSVADPHLDPHVSA